MLWRMPIILCNFVAINPNALHIGRFPVFTKNLIHIYTYGTNN